MLKNETHKLLDELSIHMLGYIDQDYAIDFLANKYILERDINNDKHKLLAESFDNSFTGSLRNKSHINIGVLDIDLELIIKKAKLYMGMNTSREDAFYVFKNNKSTVLIGGLEEPMQKTEHYIEFEELLQPLFKLLQSHYQYESIKAYSVLISELNPGEEIPTHKDIPLMFTHTHRCHLVLRADEGVVFKSIRKVLDIKPGDVFELNNDRLYHSVVNNSSRARYHLVVDCFDGGGEAGLVND